MFTLQEIVDAMDENVLELFRPSEHLKSPNHELAQGMIDLGVAAWKVYGADPRMYSPTHLRKMARISYRLAIAQVCLRKYEIAESYYREAHTLAPDDADIMGDYSLTLWRLGKTEQAYNLMADARISDPSNGTLWIGTGQMKESDGLDRDAKAYYSYGVMLLRNQWDRTTSEERFLKWGEDSLKRLEDVFTSPFIFMRDDVHYPWI